MGDVLKTACGVGLFGLGLGLYSKSAASLPAAAIRPPGALPEDRFNGACIRCGLCVRDCPFDMIHLARLGDPVADRDPVLLCPGEGLRDVRGHPLRRCLSRPMPWTTPSPTSTRRAWGLRSWWITRTASPSSGCAARSAIRSVRSRTRPSPWIATTMSARESTPCSSRWSIPIAAPAAASARRRASWSRRPSRSCRSTWPRANWGRTTAWAGSRSRRRAGPW